MRSLAHKHLLVGTRYRIEFTVLQTKSSVNKFSHELHMLKVQNFRTSR